MTEQVAGAPVPPAPGTPADHHAVELRREASTMALGAVYPATILVITLDRRAEERPQRPLTSGRFVVTR